MQEHGSIKFIKLKTEHKHTQFSIIPRTYATYKKPLLSRKPRLRVKKIKINYKPAITSTLQLLSPSQTEHIDTRYSIIPNRHAPEIRR